MTAAQKRVAPHQAATHPVLGLRATAVAIFAIGLMLRLALVIIRHDYLTPLADEPPRVARSIVKSGVFGNPWMAPTGPTAQYAPFQPFLISIVYQVFGTGERGELARHVLGSAASSLVNAVLPYAAASMGLPPVAGVIGGLAGALLPLKYHTEVSGAWEAPWAALVLILLTVRAYRRLAAAALGSLEALIDGAIWGVAFLISPSLMPVLAGLVVMECFRFLRAYRARYLAFVALRLAVIICLLAPWTLRNYKLLNELCLVRCGFGLELYTSNNPEAHVGVEFNLLKDSLHPSFSQAECARIIKIGEKEYYHEKLWSALEWINAHPRRFIDLTVARFVVFWFPWTSFPLIDVLYWTLAVASLLGMAALVRARHSAVPLFANIWLTYPAMYYIIQASTKYRCPIDWTLLLMAGVAIQGGIQMALMRFQWKPARLPELKQS